MSRVVIPLHPLERLRQVLLQIDPVRRVLLDRGRFGHVLGSQPALLGQQGFGALAVRAAVGLLEGIELGHPLAGRRHLAGRLAHRAGPLRVAGTAR